MKTVSGSSLSKRLTSTVSTGDLRGDMAPKGQVGMGRIMSVFMQEQREQEQERIEDERLSMDMIDTVPELRSPIPQKPRLSVRIPEEVVSQVASASPPTANSTTSDGFHSSQATLSPELELKSPKLGSAERASSTAATTPNKTPSRSSLFLEDRPSKPPTDPLPSLPLPPQFPKPSSFGFTLNELRKGLRKTKSSSRLLGGRPPYLLSHKNGPIEPIPSPSLRRTKSSRALGSETSSSTAVSFLRPDQDLGGKPWSPPTTMTESRLVTPVDGLMKPMATKDLIDIHDPKWLIKHGLKWDAHGLGVVSANV
ncbi:hypothetical protein N0V93_001091 [Gnomoniopsis smithogilvyi]|uniref:Uncharacterized protein n=1 Tax=Gnomoniopsis smithogilvyi TaxID=1191159 RepID=A0A9W8Z4X8_9PEZI|nr:hypothetical protein N0V93_001091 [Gnomoniopsis smithogilvyi]